MLDARSFGYLGGLGGKSNFDSVLSGGFLTPEMQEGYDRGSGIRNRLNETDYSALSNYNYNVKRANYLGEEFEYNPDYDGLSTNLMYHKDYVADSDELKAAKNSLRAAGFADIPLFEPSSWAQAGVQFIKPNQFNAKTLPYSVSGAGVANEGIRESNVFGTLNNLWSEWGQYESSGFEGGNKMGGNKSIWEAMKTWNTGDRPESVNSIGSDYGSQAALATYLETGEITEDFNPTYALEAYDYGLRETARQQQTKTPSFFKSFTGAVIGAIVGSFAGPVGAGVGAATGAGIQGAVEGNSPLSVLTSMVTSYFGASSIATGFQNAANALTTQTVNTAVNVAGKVGLGGVVQGAYNAVASPILTLAGSQAAGLTGNYVTALTAGVSAGAYANAANAILSGNSLANYSTVVLNGLRNNVEFMKGLNYSQVANLANAAGSSTLVDAATKVLNTVSSYTGYGENNAAGFITGTGETANVAIETIEAKEYAKDAEVAAEEFGKDFGTVYEDAYSDDNASSQDSTLGALGPAMNPASRFTRRYGRTRFVAA